MLPQIRTSRISSSPGVAKLPLLTHRSSTLENRPKVGITSNPLPKPPPHQPANRRPRNLKSAAIEIKKRQLLAEKRHSSTLNLELNGSREIEPVQKPGQFSLAVSKGEVGVQKSESIKGILPIPEASDEKHEKHESKKQQQPPPSLPPPPISTATTQNRKTPEQMLDEILRQEKFSFRRERVQRLANRVGDGIQEENPSYQSASGVDEDQNNCLSVEKAVESGKCTNSSAVDLNTHNRSSITSLTWKGFESAPWPEGTKIPVERISDTPSQREIEAKFFYKPAKKWVRLPTSLSEVRVPGRSILPLKKLPQDPLAKFINEQTTFSMGFWSKIRQDSACTADDASLIHQAALFRLCEAFTENMGRDYLKAMARESVQPISSSDDEQTYWHEDSKFVHDDNERIWNWDSSLPTSKCLRDEKVPKEPERSEVCSLMRDSLDMKSDFSSLFMIGSDASTDVEYDEYDFVKANKEHPFTDPRLIAGLKHQSLARDRWLKRQRKRSRARRAATEELVSDIQPEQSAAVEPDHPSESLSTPPQAGEQLRSEGTAVTTSSPEATTNQTQESAVPTTSIISATGPMSEREESESEAVSGGPNLDEKGKKSRRKRTRAKPPSQSKQETKAAAKTKVKSGALKKLVIDSPNDEKDVLMWTYMTGFEDACIGWQKQLIASAAPNPMSWIENLESASMVAAGSAASGEAEKDENLGKYGLSKRFASVAGGLEQLRRYLVAFAESEEPKAEVLLDCMVKDYVLQMPLAVRDPEHLKEVYLATVVKHPMLFKMVLRKRDILPEDLQVFVKEILELAEASDAMLTLRHPSESKSRLITDAAKEMFTSGLLYGGPKCPPEMMRQVSAPKPNKLRGISQLSEVEREQKQRAKSLRLRQIEEAEATDMGANGGSNALSNYNADIANELAFYVSLRNPSQNILEEIAFKFAEFGSYIRPLFEKRWEQISTEREPESLLPELKALRDLRCKQMERMNYRLRLSDELQKDEGGKVQRLCKSLVLRLCRLLRGPAGTLPGSGAWMGLLACLQGIMFWPLIGDLLVCKLNFWLPPLFLTLHNRYASVREEGCCVLAYLVCSYPFFSRLHQYSRQLLICNLTFALLDAMDCNRDTYVFYHGVMGYLLHSIPCTGPIDCLLMWVPEIADRKDSLAARDWPLYIYYVAKHWPDFAMDWNLLYQRQVLALLQTGLQRSLSKRNAKTAILYLVRRTKRICPLLTAWRQKDGD